MVKNRRSPPARVGQGQWDCMPDDSPEQYAVLTAYEVARCMAAIEAIARLGKPVAEVCARAARDQEELQKIEADVQTCIRLSGEQEVWGFVRRVDEARVTYGYYRYPWALEAFESLTHLRSALEPRQYEWVSGLLFGYQAEAIHQWLTAASDAPASTSQHGGAVSTAGTCHPSRGRSRTHTLSGISRSARTCVQ